jgi:hypothetical protein
MRVPQIEFILVVSGAVLFSIAVWVLAIWKMADILAMH